MSYVIVQVGGGLVQDVFKTGRGSIKGVAVMDFDVEGSEDETNTVTKDEKGIELRASVSDYGFSKLPKGSDVDRLFKQWVKDGRP